MPGLLYPSIQKYYSAISSLERFNKENSFFDNISSLDIFFSEFRNITFVMQKSLAHTEYKEIYEKNRDKYLNCRWLVEKRNETTKKQPFQLVKRIKITIYFPDEGLPVSIQHYSVENDIPLDSLMDSIKQMLHSVNPIEVFFSADFSFYERGCPDEIYEKLIGGVRSMKNFLNAMMMDIGEPCTLCSELLHKTEMSKILILPRDMIFVNDYVYYPKIDTFERAERISLATGEGEKTISRRPLETFSEGKLGELGSSNFQRFVVLHALMQSTDILPAIMTIFSDDTFELDAFNADIKTTIYRKLNEVAHVVLSGNVEEVFFMTTYVSCSNNMENSTATSKSRLLRSSAEYLAFMRVDKNFNEEEYVFDGSKINNLQYLAVKLKSGGTNRLDLGSKNMAPIVRAFKKAHGSKHKDLE